MSDYATCVTEPFWESRKPGVYAYFAAEGWTAVTGDRGIVSFCRVFRDVSLAAIADQVYAAAQDIEELGSGGDLRLCLVDDNGTITPFSLSAVRADRIARQQEGERALQTP